ncbi:MAG: hypothetical protein IAE89_06720 [Anaerolineae bacterium]|nr:hypothetical protein [Anaerolineae bacterium]
MQFWQILDYAHSGFRWIVMLAAVVALVYMIYGLVTRRAYDRRAGLVMTIFVRCIEIQWLLGLILIVLKAIALGGFLPAWWGHLILMTVAVVVAHMYMGFKRRPDNIRYVIGLVAIIAVLVLIILGVMALGGSRWGMPTAPETAALIHIV